MDELNFRRCSTCRKDNLTIDMFKLQKSGKLCKTCRICSFRKLQYSNRGKRIFHLYMKAVEDQEAFFA